MPTKARTMFETRNDLPGESREKVIELLNARLADSFDLYSQLKQAHWSVRGPDFIQLHELYDTVAESVLGFVDEIAERATSLGGLATGTVRMAAEASALEEYPLEATSDLVHESEHALRDGVVELVVLLCPRATTASRRAPAHRGIPEGLPARRRRQPRRGRQRRVDAASMNIIRRRRRRSR
jgi:starvation-inducible DNA-binding protein